MKSIRKLQNNAVLLENLIKIFIKYMMDIFMKNMIYIPEINLLTKIKENKNVKYCDLVKVKLFYFLNEANFKQKNKGTIMTNSSNDTTNFDDYTMNNNTEQFLSVLIILAPLVLFLVLTITCLVNTYGFHNLFYVIFLIIVIEKMGLIKTNVGSTIGIS